MIGSALSRLDTAEKLSIPQLQQAIQSGSIPAYMGVPLLEEKIAFEQRMRSAAAARMAQGQQPTIAEQVMDQAQNQQMMDEGGIDQIPIEEPEFAGGGIVAFEDGGQVQRFQNQGLVDEGFTPPQRGFLGTIFGPSAGMISREEIVRELTGPELQEFNRTGQLPARLRGKVGDMTIAAPSGARDEGIAAAAPVAPRVAAQPQEPRTDLRAPVQMVDGRPVPVGPKGEELGIAPDMEEKPSALETPAVSRPRNMESIIGEATRMTDALGLGPKEGERAPTIEEASKQTTELLEKSGYDEGLLKRMGQDIAKQREGLEADRSEAKAYRLIEAGLGIMSGTSANAFENIGKGATPALKGLASDIKEIKKAEREYQLAEQNLLLKQNEAAMGKAKVTQATIDKAQDRLDKKAEAYERTRADLTKTMLSGEIQKDIARNTYSKMTDFDKQWALYSKDAKDRNETPTFEGFRRALEGTRGTVTSRQATQMAIESLKNTGIDMSTPEGKKQFEGLRNYFMQTGDGVAQGQRSQQDQRALAWANANPNDPRAKQIKEYLGVQ